MDVGKDDVGHVMAPKKGCGCNDCSLYRWYPPLLIVSTLLAGLFCLLYLTKPVKVVAPVEEGGGMAPVVVPGQPEQPAARPHEIAESKVDESRLDPLLGALPGDPVEENGLALATQGNSPPSNDQGTLRPVRVGPRQGLFVPTTPKKQNAVANVAEMTEVPEVPAARESLRAGGLTVSIPDTGESELVTVLGLDRDAESPNLLMAKEESFVMEEDLEALMRVEPKVSNEVEKVSVAPAASIIGEFYVEEEARAETPASILSNESI
jgi:hypothetical protein